MRASLHLNIHAERVCVNIKNATICYSYVTFCRDYVCDYRVDHFNTKHACPEFPQRSDNKGQLRATINISAKIKWILLRFFLNTTA